MNTAAHKKTAAEHGLEWSIVRGIYCELRELETLRIARTLEARKIAFATLSHKHGGRYKLAHRGAFAGGDRSMLPHFDDVAQELARTEIPELGNDDPAAALWELISSPAPALPSADEIMRRALNQAAADRPAAAPAAAGLEDLIPLPEAAGLADITEQWLRKLVATGRVRGFRIGKNYLVSKSSAEQFRRHPTAGRPRVAVPF